MPELIDNHTLQLRDKIREHLHQATEMLILVAFVRDSGVNLLIRDLEQFVQSGGKVSILFGNDFGATQTSAIETLIEAGVQLRYYSSPTSFHPKAYIFKKPNIGVAIVGSSNLSASGLTTGTEWSVLVDSNSIDFSNILLQFNRLWKSDNAREVSTEVLSSFTDRPFPKEIQAILQEEDRLPKIPAPLSADTLLRDTRNYIVHRRPDGLPSWNFQIYQRQLEQRSWAGNFFVVPVCDYQTSTQKIFAIPHSYLKENIIPFANLDDTGRYLFEIHKRTYRFNWHHSIGMDGKQFLLPQ